MLGAGRLHAERGDYRRIHPPRESQDNVVQSGLRQKAANASGDGRNRGLGIDTEGIGDGAKTHVHTQVAVTRTALIRAANITLCITRSKRN